MRACLGLHQQSLARPGQRGCHQAEGGRRWLPGRPPSGAQAPSGLTPPWPSPGLLHQLRVLLHLPRREGRGAPASTVATRPRERGRTVGRKSASWGLEFGAQREASRGPGPHAGAAAGAAGRGPGMDERSRVGLSGEARRPPAPRRPRSPAGAGGGTAAGDYGRAAGL